MGLELLTLLLGGGLLTSLYQLMKLKPESNKIKADAFNVMQETVIQLSKRISDLEEEKEELYDMIDELNKRIQKLRRQIRTEGLIPVNGDTKEEK